MIIHPDTDRKAPFLILVAEAAGTLPVAARGHRTALVEWENEGGSLSVRQGVSLRPVSNAPSTASNTGDCQEVIEMQARLNVDLAEGLVGERFNTYEHRARLVRQLRSRMAGGPSGPPRLSGLSAGRWSEP